MTEENENPTEVVEDVPPPPATPPPQWEYRTNFKVNDRMKDIVNLSIEVSKAEIKRLRKKIDKLTYGS
jgi:hypothetical protein